MGPCADSQAGEEDRSRISQGSAFGVPSMMGIVPPLLQLGHCSGTTPGLVAWLSPYLW